MNRAALQQCPTCGAMHYPTPERASLRCDACERRAAETFGETVSVPAGRYAYKIVRLNIKTDAGLSAGDDELEKYARVGWEVYWCNVDAGETWSQLIVLLRAEREKVGL